MGFRTFNPEKDRAVFAEGRLYEFVGGSEFKPVMEFNRFLEAFHAPGLFFVFEEVHSYNTDLGLNKMPSTIE